jgi:hypothetical protein
MALSRIPDERVNPAEDRRGGPNCYRDTLLTLVHHALMTRVTLKAASLCAPDLCTIAESPFLAGPSCARITHPDFVGAKLTFIAKRSDVSEWLIHFVRDRDPDTDFPCEDEAFYAQRGNLAVDAPAATVLRHILRTGGLRPAYSFRASSGGIANPVRTTIYGGKPVVCFTEAPLQGFGQYVAGRAKSQRCAPYGICLLKREVFAVGGRPVIYGLAGQGMPHVSEDSIRERIIDPEVLPLNEQFRYVAYDPTRVRPLDWTHEREWRWTPTDPERHRFWGEGPRGKDDYPGLPLFTGRERGGFFSRVGFIMNTREEAADLAAELLRYRDAGNNDDDTPYSRDLLALSFVVPLDDALACGESRIEDLAKAHMLVAAREDPTPDLLEHVRAAVAKAREVSTAAGTDFLATAPRTKDGHIADICGSADVVTTDSTSIVTAALLKCSLAEPRHGEYYVVDALGEHHREQALGYKEVVAQAACDCLAAELGDIFFVWTRRD